MLHKKHTYSQFFIILSRSDKIPTVEQCTYLGITISTNDSDVNLKRQMRKLYANVNLLLRKFSTCSVEVKCFLFKMKCLEFLSLPFVPG